MKTKNIIIRFLSIAISTAIIFNFTFFNFYNIAFASDNDDFFAQYSGSTEASWGYKPNCTFTINKIVDNRFRGRFAASNLGSYSFNEAVEGKAYTSNNSITCIFTVKFYNDRYYSNIVATVNMLEGTCECFCVGSWHMEDFVMTGTKFSYPTNYGVGSEFSAYSEEDMKICMALSDAIYDFKSVSDNEFLDITKNYGIDKENNETSFYNMLDSNAENVAFAITNRENSDGSIDMFVVLRGTLKDEWQGNTEVTGTSFDESILVHDNFNKAKESIKSNISKYYSRMKEKSDTVNLIITGHSRGAAVANLYAKEATDKSADIPDFNNVTAYTFACPNVEKYNGTMENYKNIFNFCFKEDIVPTVPLTSPVNGWNYWKYGQTYMANLSNYNNDINASAVKEIHNALSLWQSVNAYYNLPVVSTLSVSGLKSTTLYDVAHDLTGTFMSYGAFSSRRFISASKVLLKIDAYPALVPLIYGAVKNANSIRMAHHYDSYNNLINGTNSSTAQSDSVFYHCSYDEYSNINLSYDNGISAQNELNYNTSQVENLTAFYNSNADILDWDIDDPSTWTGIEWDSNGNVENIDLSYKNLNGDLDLSNFSSLVYLNVSGNNLTSLNLNGCSGLQEIDCSFNKLTDIDMSDCTALTSLVCCYNYLDIHDGGTLYTTLDDLMFGDCYVNYYPQSIPENAVFNTGELSALEAFAKIDNNNSALNWIDESGNILTDELQNNVMFEYDGNEYRITAIDISDIKVSGELDLTAFTQLKELYCENTYLTSLNIKNSTLLSILKCDGSRLNTLTLPSNAGDKNSALYDISCEYNYLDTSIFTEDVVKYVEFKAGGSIEYINQKGDTSALIAAIETAKKFKTEDYSEDSYNALKEILDECESYDFDNLYMTQQEIDDRVVQIMAAIYDLKAYFYVTVQAQNCTVSAVCSDDTVLKGGRNSVLQGTKINASLVPDDGCIFVGWYDVTSNLYLSKDEEYSFNVSANITLKAMCVPEKSATLTFTTFSNWVAKTVTKTAEEWAQVSGIDDLLPNVPYRYGHTNGRWEYDADEVLAALRSGENVNIVAQYDGDASSLPTPRTAEDKPLLDLYYKYDSEADAGSFVMATGLPQDIRVDSVGVAFYRDNSQLFDPTDNFTLTLNNKMLVGRFNTDELQDVYIVDVHNMKSDFSWAARGFVTYYGADGELLTEYSNQINIINLQEVFATGAQD